MDRELYIKDKIDQLSKYWYGIASSIGASLFLSLGIMDYFSAPEHFTRFLLYRLGVSLLLLVSFFINRKLKSKYRTALFTYAIIISAAAIELMVLDFGGHRSTYYVGFIILVICVLGLIPMNLPLSLLGISIIYSIYLIPILILDPIVDFRTFFTANSFLISFFAIAVVWRYSSQKNLIKTLGLQYDLDQEREKLAKYSTQLEQLVAERTRELNKSNVMLNSLFENAGDGIMIIDRDGIILSANHRACEIHGFDKGALIGANIGLLEPEENKQICRERMERLFNGESLVFETQHYKKDGSRVSLEISSKAVEVDGSLLIQSFHRDITEKKRLQKQLFQSQKMESIGALAGGIAHDFNNILSAILGNAQLLYEFSDLDESSKRKVRVIENSSRRAGQMVSKLLSFARQGSSESFPLNLNAVIRDTIELIERMMMKRNIEIKMEIDNTIPSINGDSNRLEQVIMNLVVNAADAMPDGGLITIATSPVTLGRDASRIHPLLAPGKYVVLKVADTGSGIPDAIRDRIFDPFFTTKGPGKGTGLGLAMVYGIVKDHKGIINVESRAGKGTTFDIYLPASERPVFKSEEAAVHSTAGREKLLVVDDEEDVLTVIKDILETQGYKVVATTNPVYALDLFKELHDTIDLVITDIVMPLVNGRELIRHFKIIKPALKVIAISGYDARNTGKREKDIDAYIRKPFDGLYLFSIVRKVLDSTGSSAYSRQRPI